MSDITGHVNMDSIIKLQEYDRFFADAARKEEQGDYAGAVEVLSALTSRYPDHAKAWAALGDLMQYKFSDTAAAETCYQKALEIDPRLAKAYTAYADVLLGLQRYAEANAMVNKALGLSGPGLDQALYKSGLFRESQARFDEAVDAYKKAILATFSDETIIACEKAIHRCEVKKKYL
jgi:tetratricopeptide (TPR) repeat protein